MANRFRSQLAVSIYHTPERFIEIPRRLMDGLIDFDFHFYRYSPAFGEGTLYAVPKERRRKPTEDGIVR